MWMNRICRLGEVEEFISEMDFFDVADDIAETEEDIQLIVSGWWVFLPQLNLQLHEGILCNWDEEEQMFMPDVAVTVVYEADADRTEYIYFEPGRHDSNSLQLAEWETFHQPDRSLKVRDYRTGGWGRTQNHMMKGKGRENGFPAIICQGMYGRRKCIRIWNFIWMQP